MDTGIRQSSRASLCPTEETVMYARQIRETVLFAVSLTLCVLASADCAAPAAPIRPIDGWYSIPRVDLPHTLEIQPVENGWRVTDRVRGVVLEVPEEDVRFSGEVLQIRENPKVRLLQTPSESSDRLEAPSAAAKKSCDSIFGCKRVTYCIGFVQVCCSTSKVIGACLGAWDCGCP
jgi:hypothetical protein